MSCFPLESRLALRNILHISHQLGGGISSYIEDLTISSRNYSHIYRLTCWQGKIHLEYERDGGIVKKQYNLYKDIQSIDFTDKKYAQILSSILEEFAIDIVHVNTQIGHTFDIFTVPASRHIPIIYTVHDYFYICPAIHLVDTRGEYCGICLKGTTPSNCLDRHSFLFYLHSSNLCHADLLNFREKFRSIMNCINFFVFPSHASKNIFAQYYQIDESLCRVIYHGAPISKSNTLIRKKERGKLYVGIIGTMFKHKGQNTIQALINSLKTYPVKFFHFGGGNLVGENLQKIGIYNRNNIVELIQSKEIDVSLLLSTWPETFSYTLTESIAANVPAIVTNMGALAERVSAYKIGWLVDYRDVGGIRDLILRLSGEKTQIEEYKNRLITVKLKTTVEMQQEYVRLYESVLRKRKHRDTNVNISNGRANVCEDNENGMFYKNIRVRLIFIMSKFVRLRNRISRLFSNR